MARSSDFAFAVALAPWWLCVAVLASCLPSLAFSAPPSRGVAVLVLGPADVADRAWGFARAVYASRALLPAGITEPRARTLVGQPVAAATAETRELAELRDGVHDEGAVSRRVLGAIAGAAQAAAVAVVRPGDTPGHVQVRLYVTERAAFDVTLYDGDPGDAAWRADVVKALERRFDPEAKPAAVAPPRTPRADTTGPRPFYKSPWFWGAIGGAVLLGGTALIVTKITSNDDVRVRVEPPGSAASALRFQGRLP